MTLLTQVGIVVGLLSTCIQSVGLTLQRKSHLLEDEKLDGDIRRPPYRRRRWQVGMFMFVMANLVGSTIQITTLPLPVLSTLQASGLVFNTVCASLILREPFTRWSFIGTSLIAGGAVLIAMYGALAEPSHNLAQLLELLGRRQFLLWMFGTFVIIAFILASIFFINRIHSNSNSHAIRVYKGFAYGGISSILSAHSLLVAKSAVELLVRTIADHKNQFNRWQSWMILLLLVFFALTQLYFLHRGLKLVSTSILYPFVFCIYNIVAILDGLIYFRQTDRLPPLHTGFIALGTVILLSGVLALSWRITEETDAPPPPDAHSLLTPGMGIVEDTTTEDEGDDHIDDDNASVTSADEERPSYISEVTPLLKGRRISKSPGLRFGKTRIKNNVASPSIDVEQTTVSESTFWGDEPNKPRTLRAVTGVEIDTKGHKRVHSDAVKPTTSRSSSADDLTGRPQTRIHRARTVHGSGPGVSFGPVTTPGTPHNTMTWRERDRERRKLKAWRAPPSRERPRRSRSVSAPGPGLQNKPRRSSLFSPVLRSPLSRPKAKSKSPNGARRDEETGLLTDSDGDSDERGAGRADAAASTASLPLLGRASRWLGRLWPARDADGPDEHDRGGDGRV